MIKSLKVTGLNRRMSFDLAFHEDINIVTGRNGSGKTTVLKLLWYAISGNLERIIQEIPFESFSLETDKIYVAMEREPKPNPTTVMVHCRIGASDLPPRRVSMGPGEPSRMLDPLKRQLAVASGSSVFFPTFRRIEGGFSTRSAGASVLPSESIEMSYWNKLTFEADTGPIQQAMNQLSDRPSIEGHRFVASVSTDDIKRLSKAKYAELLEWNNRRHMDFSQFVLNHVDENEANGPGTISAERQARSTLEEIGKKARSVRQETEAVQRPFLVLSDLVSRIFRSRGVRVDIPLTLDKAPEAIGSDLLSAGEKQMLSFLCYNAFASDSCIFIDEPEISLHVDWQRLLLPILLEQSTGNQFIVATHSPFIYSRYADKELPLDPDRGDEDAAAPPDGKGDHRHPRENELADVTG